nr:HD domain-containing protein [Listeria ilorinensis]
MKVYSDPLYGEYILESILVDLINSAPVQRLKKIHQGGASYLVNPKWNLTRYEHSIGVMLLIRKLGGALEEQIAGLLHDVSHTAFSHVIDLSLDGDDYHDKIFNKVVFDSEIPYILQKYNYSVKNLLSQKWPLLDMGAPFLSADRIDYTLRDMYTYQNISLEQCHNFIDSLIVKEAYIVSNSLNQCI